MEELQKPVAEIALDAIPNLRATLMAGFTTVREMLVSVHAIGSTGGHCNNQAGFHHNLFGKETNWKVGLINSPDQARAGGRSLCVAAQNRGPRAWGCGSEPGDSRRYRPD